MRKEGIQFLLCLLLSAGVWLIHNLSQTYVSVVSVPVIAKSNIDARAEVSSTDATVTAQVKASGFRHFLLSRARKRPLTVVFNPSDFKYSGGDRYSLQSSALYKYGSAIFGDGSSVESFLSDELSFSFNPESHKKVPVQQVQSLSFKSQYMALGPMRVQPDSVYVYGEPSRLESIDRVLTKPVELSEIDADVHGTVKLDVPRGLRLSDEVVKYSVDVSRYVELRSEVKIQTRNVPSGQSLSVLPSTAEVVFRCAFPVSVDPSKTADFYVDYKDFSVSLTGRCVAKCDNMPSGVIDWSISPEVVDCMLKAK